MLSGFVEGHFHTTTPGILLRGVDLQSDTMGELLGKLGEHAEDNPNLEQVHGWGVWPDSGGPTAIPRGATPGIRSWPG